MIFERRSEGYERENNSKHSILNLMGRLGFRLYLGFPSPYPGIFFFFFTYAKGITNNFGGGLTEGTIGVYPTHHAFTLQVPPLA